VAEGHRHERGVLDTSVVIDLDKLRAVENLIEVVVV
jgi:hypothetical protein